ncbi:MAG TPA: hypothetical protein VN223_01380 [Candidatus Elarobacter sp.]|nr:hypothetical protein [Candidatus Elarobacter sp.]
MKHQMLQSAFQMGNRQKWIHIKKNALIPIVWIWEDSARKTSAEWPLEAPFPLPDLVSLQSAKNRWLLLLTRRWFGVETDAWE